MEITAWWDNTERTAMHCGVKGEWMWRDFGRILQTCFDSLRPLTYQVDLVIDLTCAAYKQRGQMDVPYTMPDVPEKCGLIVVCSNDPAVHIALSMFRHVQRMAGQRLLCTTSDDETRELLKNLTATRPHAQLLALQA